MANLHIIRSKMRHHHFLNFKEKSRAFLVDIRDRTSSAVNLTERKIPTLPHFSPLFVIKKDILGDPEVTVNLYCYFAYPYWEGCVICSIYLR